MELEDDGWRNEMGKCIRSVGNLTETALKRIKRDRIRNNLPFDGAFQNYFVQKINARIADVYTDVLFDESLDGGPNLTSHDVNGNGNANILEMPVIMTQSNDQNASTPLVQNDNEMLEQIVISIPSIPLSIPQNIEPELHAESNRASIPVPSGANDCRRMEGLIDNMPNRGNENRKQVCGRSAMQSVSTSVSNQQFHDSFERMVDTNKRQPETIDLTKDQGEANEVKNRMITPKRDVHVCGSPLPLPNVAEQSNFSQNSVTVASNNANDAVANGRELVSESSVATVPKANNNQRFEPIALSEIYTEFNSHEARSDKARARGGEGGNQRLNVASSLSPQYPESIDLISDDEDDENQAANNFPKNMEIVVSQVQPSIQGRKRENENANASGYLKKKPKLANNCAMDTKKRHKCDFCEYSTKRKWDLTAHIRTHTNERPYRCEVCEKRFNRKHHLIDHMKTHRHMFAFQCSNCRQGFSAEKEWKLHESRCKARGYECHLCKKMTLHKQNLVNHMRAHTGEKLHCPKCRKQFNSDRGLARHMKSHGNLFRFQCSNCRQGFSKKTLWKSHENRCKLQQFECFLCSKKFHHQRGNLLAHMRFNHTGEKPFGCSDCPKRFCEKEHLRRHTNSRH